MMVARVRPIWGQLRPQSPSVGQVRVGIDKAREIPTEFGLTEMGPISARFAGTSSTKSGSAVVRLRSSTPRAWPTPAAKWPKPPQRWSKRPKLLRGRASQPELPEILDCSSTRAGAARSCTRNRRQHFLFLALICGTSRRAICIGMMGEGSVPGALGRQTPYSRHVVG